MISSVKSNLTEIREGISQSVTLVVVSKTYPNETILEAYDCGERIFGENRPQEMLQKYNSLPNDIQWHFIGTLQTNKVKYIAPFVSLIHSVDSEKLLAVIDKEAKKNDRVIDVLMEVFVAQESTKHGWDRSQLSDFLSSASYKKYPNVSIKGVMGMATYTQDQQRIKQEFSALASIFEEMKAHLPQASVLSMGMSGDYLLAIEQGSTMVRIGSAVFGQRMIHHNKTI